MIDVLQRLEIPSGSAGTYHSLPLLENKGVAKIPRRAARLDIKRRDGRKDSVPLVVRIDTPIEVAYVSAGGILPYVLEQLLADGGRGGPQR